jgi:hypothetical protein
LQVSCRHLQISHYGFFNRPFGLPVVSSTIALLQRVPDPSLRICGAFDGVVQQPTPLTFTSHMLIIVEFRCADSQTAKADAAKAETQV